MGQALENLRSKMGLVALSGTEHVGSYDRTTSTGKVIHVGGYSRDGGMSWDEVKAKNPLYSQFGFDSAVNELALNHREWTGEAQPLAYTEEKVHPRDVRFQRYPASDSRVAAILHGYKSGAEIPPVLLVNRGGEHLTADGHHRLSAAEILKLEIQAVVAQSPREDAYSGKAAIGRTKAKKAPSRT